MEYPAESVDEYPVRRPVQHHNRQRSLRDDSLQRASWSRNGRIEARTDPYAIWVARPKSRTWRADFIPQLWSGAGAGFGESSYRQSGCVWSRTGWSFEKCCYATIQPVHFAFSPKPAQPHEPRPNYRQHHLAVVRRCKPDGGRRRRILGECQQPPVGTAVALYVLISICATTNLEACHHPPLWSSCQPPPQSTAPSMPLTARRASLHRLGSESRKILFHRGANWGPLYLLSCFE